MPNLLQTVIDEIVDTIYDGNDSKGFPIFRCTPGNPALKGVLLYRRLSLADVPEIPAHYCDCEIVWNLWDHWTK